MGIVTLQGEIFKGEIKQICHRRIQFHGRIGSRLSRQLQLNLLHVVAVNVRIAKGMHEIARLQPQTCAIIIVSRA